MGTLRHMEESRSGGGGFVGIELALMLLWVGWMAQHCKQAA